MPVRFTATENAIEKGLETLSPTAAIKLIEGWEAALQDAEFSGAKTIARDLGALKKAMGADEPDDAKVKELLGKLGAETTRSASKADEKTADKVKALGEALEQSAA